MNDIPHSPSMMIRAVHGLLQIPVSAIASVPQEICLRMVMTVVVLTLSGTPTVVLAEQAAVRLTSVACVNDVNNTIAVTSAFSCRVHGGGRTASEQQIRACQAQQAVKALVSSIESHQADIARSNNELRELYLRSMTGHWTARTWRLLVYFMAWSYRQIEAVGDYWRIGTLESSLLIEYSKTGAYRSARALDNDKVDCQAASQLLAGTSLSSVGMSEF